jgi:hypothetical protein
VAPVEGLNQLFMIKKDGNCAVRARSTEAPRENKIRLIGLSA